MRATLWLITGFLGIAPPLSAQQSPEQRAVLAVVDSFFASMSRRDTALARAVLFPGAMAYIALPGRAPVASADTAFIRSLATSSARLQERIWNPRVEVHGSIAEVWTRYDFHVDGKFSHCGIDDFSLIQTPAGWRIVSVTYTVEQTGCPESPLGPLPPG
jgi:hypothetical protein